MEQATSYGALNWVKKELDETLKLARQALEDYVEGTQDVALLQQAALHLHQAQGTLQMVEVYGAAQLAEELEITAKALVQGEVSHVGDAYEVLARAILQLQEYLNRVHAGQQDVPSVLLPLLNDLRALRGASLLSEGALFPLDLTPLSSLPPGVKPAALAAAQASVMVRRLRNFYQLGLLGWLRGQETDKNLAQLEQALLQLSQLAAYTPVSHLWWIGAGLIEALRRKGLESNATIKLLLGQLDRQIKRLVDAGEAELAQNPLLGLYKNLLYYVAQSRVQSTRITQIKQTFALATLLPEIAQLESARSNLLGPDIGVMQTVLTAIKEEMTGVKEGLDLFTRQTTRRGQDLAPLADSLHKIADTLGMLGYGALRRRVQQQEARLRQMLGGADSADDAALMQIAGELLYVEASLGGAPSLVHTTNVTAQDTLEDAPLVPEAEFQTVRLVVMRELLLDLGKAKDGIIAFNSAGQRDLLELAPQYLRGVQGVMAMLEFSRAARIVAQIADYVQHKLLTAAQAVPNAVEMLAEALSGVEYYLEIIQQRLPDHTDSLGQAELRLAALSGASAQAVPARISAAEHSQAAPSLVAAQEVSVAPSVVLAGTAVWPADKLDEDIIDIFLEEANEVIDSIRIYWPQWRYDPDQREALITVRRGFHTLKGSGRMAGAHSLGEFAWSAETLINRILDGTIQPNSSIYSVMEQIVALLPSMVQVLIDHGSLPAQAKMLAAYAHALGRGESVDLLALSLPVMPDTEAVSAVAIVTEPVVAEAVIVAPVATIVAATPVVSAPRPAEAALPAAPLPTVPQPLELDVDDDILSIFMEEAQEVLEALREQFPLWRADQTQRDALAIIRRGFHTLKGSGRMVGAMVVGELAWSIESLLNRVMEGTVSPSPAMMTVIGASLDAFPVLLESLQARLHSTLDVEPIMRRAQALAKGELFPEETLPEVTPVVVPEAEVAAAEVAEAEVAEAEVAEAEVAVAEVAAAEVAEAEVAVAEVAEAEVAEAEVAEAEVAVAEVPEAEVAEAEVAVAEVAEAEVAEAEVAVAEVAEAVIAADAIAPSATLKQPEYLVMDEMLHEIFDSEARAHLAVVEEFLLHCQQSAVPCRGSDVLARAVHTLHGSAHMAGAKDIAEVSGGLELLVRGYILQQIPFDTALLTLLEESLEKIAQSLICINQPGKLPPNCQTLIDALRRLNESLQVKLAGVALSDAQTPEDTDTHEQQVTSRGGTSSAPDAELIAIFLNENNDILRSLNVAVDAWRNQSNDAALGMELQRLLHTLKGSARLVGFQSMGDMAQALEGLIGASVQRHEALSGSALDLVHRALDTLSTMLNEVAQGGVPEAADVLVAELYAQGVHPVAYEDTAAVYPLSAEEQGEDQADAVAALDADTELLEPWVAPDAIPAAIPVAQEPVLPAAEASPAPQVSPEDQVSVVVVGVAPAADAVARTEAPLVSSLLPIEVAPSLAAAEVETYDGDLIGLFQEEGKELLDGLDASFHLWRDAPQDSGHNAQIQRLLHTLKGSARLVGLAGVGDLTHAVESLVVKVQQGEQVVNAEMLQLVQHVFDHLATTLDQLTKGETLYRPSQLIAAVETYGHVAPVTVPAQVIPAPLSAAVTAPPVAPTVAPTRVTYSEGEQDSEYDQSLLSIFLEEGKDILDNLEGTFQPWSRLPQDAALSAQLKRSLHTLKGGARLVGVVSVGDLSHALETALNVISEQNLTVDAQLILLLRRTLDALSSMLERVGRNERVYHPTGLIHALERVGQQGVGVAIEPEVPAARPSVMPQAIEGSNKPQTAEAASARAPQEQIRVRADLLDNLVNFAGEISIYRARLEQQWTSLKFNLVEFEQTTRRLREQLRKLELETEAQVLFRYEKEGGDHHKFAEFDPLEMDRYSTIQQLSRALSESVADLDNLHRLMNEGNRDSETLLLQQSRVNTELQEGLMRTRMVPFANLVPRLRRLVRQTADSVGKRAELDVIGGEGEMDRTILERITAPLEHLLRNAIAHGIETPAERVLAGKPEVGSVALLLTREGAEIVMEIADDGRGINPTAIRKKAIQMGLLKPETVVSEIELIQFILESGFSTAKDVSQIAGRGVGMDVVNNEIKQMGGTLGIKSQVGAGSRFIINLPFTLAINQAILVHVGEDIFAVPLTALEGIVRVPQSALAQCYAGEREGIDYAGQLYHIKHLGGLLGTMDNNFPEQKRWYPVLLVRSGDFRVALHVESLLGNREIVIKSVGPQLSTVRWISGATILADGRVVLILDIGTISRMRVATATTGTPAFGAVEEAAPVRRLKVMVVDDSITVRKVTGRVLERYGMEVMTAKDGIEALTVLQDYTPDLMLLDIEMPRMDGFELARNVRNTEHLKQIPIIMITSRTGDKHRQRAMELGVNDYIGKPFQEQDLIAHINALIGGGVTV